MFLFKKEYEKYIDKCIKLLNKNEYTLAEKQISKAINLKSDNAYSYYLRHSINFILNEYYLALNDINKAIDIVNENYNKLFLDIEKKTYEDFESKDFIYYIINITSSMDNFKKYYSKLNKKTDLYNTFNKNKLFLIKYSEILCSKIEVLKELEEYDEALNYLDILIEKEPNNFKYNDLKVDLLKLKEKREKAYKNISEQIKNNPNNPVLYLAHARLCVNLKKYEEAEYDMQQVLKLDLTEEDIKNKISSILDVLVDYNTKQNNITKAMELITKAIELTPMNPHYYLMRGGLYFNINEKVKAKADFEKALSLSPNDIDTKNINNYLRGC